MGDVGKKMTGEDKIWEIWGRREQGRTEYGRYGKEENRLGQNMGDMEKKRTREDNRFGIYGEEENRGGQQNLGYMGKKRTEEDKIWEIWGRR